MSAGKDADLAIIYAAYFLSHWHGEDTYATELLVSWAGRSGIRRLQRLARAEDYVFKRGFWAGVLRGRDVA